MTRTPVFQDVTLGSVTLSEGGANRRSGMSHSTQTNQIDVESSSAQTWTTTSAETQTERHFQRESGPQVLAGFDAWPSMPPDVANFLEKVGVVMENELHRSEVSQAFVGYAPLMEGADNSIVAQYTLSCDLTEQLATAGNANTDSTNGSQGLQVTGVDWTSTGSTVVAAFGRNDIAGWCDLPGAVAAWNVFRRGFADSSDHKPDFLLDHRSCLMCVRCHPVNPAIIAAGSFNGEVVVWDTSRDDLFVASTKIDDLFHREPVTALSWVYNPHDDDHHIAAVSGDGKVLFWSLKNDLRGPVNGYCIQAESAFNDRGGGTTRAKNSFVRLAGCSTLSFPSEGRHTTSAIVGTEGGAVLKCRWAPLVKGAADGCKSIRWSPAANDILCRVPKKCMREVAREVEKNVKMNGGTEVDLASVFKSRVGVTRLYHFAGLFRMEKHHGPVHSLDCSPFHRALFLSSGADGCARLYNMLQSRAALEFEPSNANLMDVKWSRARPLVFAAVAEDGGLFIYDLLQSPVVPVASAQLPPPRDAVGVPDAGARDNMSLVAGYSLAFNPRQRDLLATGDSAGRIVVWKLSWRLANKTPAEDAGLERLFRGSVGDEEANGEDGQP